MKIRQEFEVSGLIEFIREYTNSSDIYKKIDNKIVLDLELTKNDLAIYLAIVKHSSFKKGFMQRIHHVAIQNITGITQSNQVRSIKKLEDKKYITTSKVLGCTTGYSINMNPSKYLIVKMEQLNSSSSVIKHIRTLRGIVLSSGNNRIPSFKASEKKCNGKLSLKEWREIKKEYNDVFERELEEQDITNYLKLNNL
jgi:hypothetical protein